MSENLFILQKMLQIVNIILIKKKNKRTILRIFINVNINYLLIKRYVYT